MLSYLRRLFGQLPSPTLMPHTTELQWPVAEEPWPMLKVLQGMKPGERKVRQFNAAVCRRFWDDLPDESKALLVESERIASGELPAPSDPMDLCWRANSPVGEFDRLYPDRRYPSAEIRRQREAAAAVCYAVLPDDLFAAQGRLADLDPAEKKPQCDLIRDIFGNPFHSVAVRSTWFTAHVRQLAQTIYSEGAFDRLPELAAAMAAAGCDESEILDHCRGPGPHVRGCWVVDLVLDESSRHFASARAANTT